MRKKIIIIISTIIAIICIGIVSFLLYFKSVVNRPLISEKSSITIEVKEGDGFSNVIETLDKNGYLRSTLMVKLKIRMNYKEINILPGSYEIDTNMSLNELINILETEDINKNLKAITIPEGYSIDDIINVVAENFSFSKEDFIEAINNYELRDYMPNNEKRKYKLEGYLYPNTYYFDIDSTPNEIIEIMILEFEDVINKIKDELGIEIKDDELDTIINKASLIEKEVKLQEEKTIVSSVIDNRIKKNMKLQFCSTVNYVIGYEGKEVLTYSDIEVDSPYNTYKYEGLPVGPICGPSYSSIKAVLMPDDTEYLYFVLSEDNKSHYFSKTIEEHEEAKKRAEANK